MKCLKCGKTTTQIVCPSCGFNLQHDECLVIIQERSLEDSLSKLVQHNDMVGGNSQGLNYVENLSGFDVGKIHNPLEFFQDVLDACDCVVTQDKLGTLLKKYSIDKDSFIDFLVEHKLPVTTHLLSGATADDAKADFYARLYKGCKAAARGEYPFTDVQREELEVRIGKNISEGMSEEKLEELEALDNPYEVLKWLRINKPNYDRVIKAETYRIVYEIESNK